MPELLSQVKDGVLIAQFTSDKIRYLKIENEVPDSPATVPRSCTRPDPDGVVVPQLTVVADDHAVVAQLASLPYSIVGVVA